MNKSELVNNVFDKTLIMHNVIQKVYDAIFDEITLALQAGDVVHLAQILDEITLALKAGDVVTLPKFGTFRVADIPARLGMNPRTKETITIPAHKRAKFSAGTVLRAAVNGGDNHGDN